jgi:cell division protein ZipA
MDPLRWILLLIGVVIIGAIYVYGRLRERGARRRLWEEEESRAGIVLEPEPSASHAQTDAVDTELQELGSRMSVADEAPVPWLHEPVKASGAEAAPEGKRRTPAVDNSSRGSHAAAGSTAPPRPAPEKIVVVYVTAPAGTRFGDMNIFHRYVDTPQGPQALFSAANLVEPGWFDLDRMETFESPGLTLFLRLPGPIEPVRAFDALVACAEQLKQTLNGELRDGTRSVLSKQTVGHLREEVQEFARKIGVTGSRAQ